MSSGQADPYNVHPHTSSDVSNGSDSSLPASLSEVLDMDGMEPMSEDEQSGGVELNGLLETQVSLNAIPALWPYQSAGASITPQISGSDDDLSSPSLSLTDYMAMGAPDPAFGWNPFEPSQLTFFPSSAFESLLFDDDQPYVSDFKVHDVCEFIKHWRLSCAALKIPSIGPEATLTKTWDRKPFVDRTDLQGEQCDIQGIDWTKLETTRATAREMRARFYVRQASASFARPLPSRDNFFSFRRLNTSVKTYISHFQLRNLVTAASDSDIYFAGRNHVNHTDGQSVRRVMNLSAPAGMWEQSRPLQITCVSNCVSSSEDMLVAGGFYGEYALTNLNSEIETQPVHGYLTHETNGITNHVHTFNHRHGRQIRAAFCSNDQRLRILDCHTNVLTDTFSYPYAINCSTTSPDGRLRMVVGDQCAALLTNAETGQCLERMKDHKDDVFACAWADDGIHVATAAQDSEVVIYDARRWDTPLTTIGTEMGCARSLRFSPVGSGQRCLFVAEASDFVNVIDARTFETCQRLDFFGTIGGMALTPDGSSLFVANCDAKFGGLIQYDQLPPYGALSDDSRFDTERTSLRRRFSTRRSMGGTPDWFAEDELDSNPQVNSSPEQRFRRGLGLEELMV